MLSQFKETSTRQAFIAILGMYFLLGINGHKDESMDKQEAFSNYSKKI